MGIINHVTTGIDWASPCMSLQDLRPCGVQSSWNVACWDFLASHVWLPEAIPRFCTNPNPISYQQLITPGFMATDWLGDFLALRRHARCLGNVALAERAAATGRPAHFARFALAALFCGFWSPFLRHLHHFMITFCYNGLIFGTLFYPRPTALQLWFASFWTLGVAHEFWACLFAFLWYTSCLGNVALAERAAATGRPAHFARFALTALFCGFWSPFLRHLHHFMITLCYHRVILRIFLQEYARSL